jgi:hypothetical protein
MSALGWELPLNAICSNGSYAQQSALCKVAPTVHGFINQLDVLSNVAFPLQAFKDTHNMSVIDILPNDAFHLVRRDY